MTGPSLIRRRGRDGRNAITHWFPPPASIASLPVGCSPTSTKSPAKFRSLKAIPSIRAAAGETAPKVRQLSIKFTIRSHTLTTQAHRKARRSKWEQTTGTPPWMTLPHAFAKPSLRIVATRSCITWPPREDGFTERILAAWALTVITLTPTFVRRGAVKVTNSGWDSIAEPRSRKRESHTTDQRPSRVGPLLQSTRTTRHRRQSKRREVNRVRHAPFAHCHACRLLGCSLSRF